MATQRVPPIDLDIYSAKIITIDSTLTPDLTGCFIAGSGQQPVTFTNNSGITINITFDSNPVTQPLFSDILNLAGGASNTQTPPSSVAGATVNYHVASGGTKNGPFAIQIGAGPMYVQVTVGATSVLTNPGTVALPNGGTLELVPGDTNSYKVSWKNNLDPFTPPISSVDSQVHTEAISGIASYDYTVTKVSGKLSTGNGGGTVKIKGS